MFLADVVGNVVSPIQCDFLNGRVLLLVQPVTPRDMPASNARIAIDTVGAGEGDRVLVIDEGNSGRQILGASDEPVKTLIVGVVDHIELHGEHTYNHCEGA
ncbi:MAG: EutN/CcmL family microcompartment protein [Planctomycetota bacterium]|nr:EutN/CcmL family microcompartment protein [Planctomycetota bacterium]